LRKIIERLKQIILGLTHLPENKDKRTGVEYYVDTPFEIIFGWRPRKDNIGEIIRRRKLEEPEEQ